MFEPLSRGCFNSSSVRGWLGFAPVTQFHLTASCQSNVHVRAIIIYFNVNLCGDTSQIHLQLSSALLEFIMVVVPVHLAQQFASGKHKAKNELFPRHVIDISGYSLY